ncbi:MAG: bile acid:sodium symporter family protein, partial [Alcaligenaceae bacterium]
MPNDQLATVALPLMLSFIMFSLGLGLTIADFRRIARSPRAFLLGVLSHFVLLPLT